MRVLTIGTDKTIMEENSVANNRQLEYYKNFESTDVYILCKGESKRFNIGNVNFVSLGGQNKLESFARTYFEIYKNYKNKKYNLIYTQDVLYCGITGLIIKKISGAKLVTQIHGDYLDNPLWIKQRLQNKVLNYLGKCIVKESDGVRAVSGRIAKYCVGDLRIDKNKVRSLPIGIDGDIFNSTNVLENRKKQIVFVGRLMEEKEPHFFCDIVIPVLEKNSEFTAVMIGSGPLEEELKKRFSDKGLQDRVFFPGFLKFPEIAKYYKESFVFLHTAFWEGWGLPMVESTVCGLPNVTTDTGCAGEVVIDKWNGIVIKNKNSQDYTLVIQDLIDNKDMYNSLVKNCLSGGEEWTAKSMTKKIESFLIYINNYEKNN